MKKIIVFLLFLTFFILTGCRNYEMEKEFIKTPEETIEVEHEFPNIIQEPIRQVGETYYEVVLDDTTAQKIAYPHVKGLDLFNAEIKKYIFSKRDNIINNSNDDFNEVVIDYEIYRSFYDYYSVKIYTKFNYFNQVDYIVFSNSDSKFISFDEIYTKEAKAFLNEQLSEPIDYNNFVYLNEEVHFLNDKKENIVVRKDDIEQYEQFSYRAKLRNIRLQNTVYIDPNKPMVALTFDDGPYPPYTDKILDCLEENDSYATFFVLGSNVKEYDGMVRKIYLSGSDIGAHTYNHPDLTELSDK